MEYIPAKDYNSVFPAQLRAQLNAPRENTPVSLVPAAIESTMTPLQLREQSCRQHAEMDALKKQIDDVRNAQTKELSQMQKQIFALQAQLEAKKQAAMALLNEKKSELERMMEQLEGQLYLLDSQIYAIRCYAGEVVRFTRLRSGNNAPITEPIVVHQKLRFLDEDLGRLTSLYSIQWEELGEFEKFLQHSPLALDTFAPNERCVMLVRLSRDGNEIGRDNRHPYSNLLRDYEYYHGRTIGIIIRNGENLYLGWTDEKRVHIQDDLIVSQVIDVTPQDEPVFRSTWDREKWEKGQKEERKRILDGLISRSFVYNILQGIVDHSTMLPLPSGVTLGKPSEYVVYSIADKWLTDNRFGSFNDLVEICNKKVIKGDILLSVQHLIPERPYWNPAHSYNPAWHNVRGRGDKIERTTAA